MTYSVKRKKIRDEKFYESEELKLMHKHPKFSEVTKEGTRFTFHAPKKIHEVGSFVEYKGRAYQVQEVTNQGVHMRSISSFGKSVHKPIFIKEHIYVRHATPYYFVALT